MENKTGVEDGLHCHIFSTQTTETSELNSVFAWLGDGEGGYFPGLALGDGVSWAKVPLVDGAFYGRIPSSETGFLLGVWKSV